MMILTGNFLSGYCEFVILLGAKQNGLHQPIVVGITLPKMPKWRKRESRIVSYLVLVDGNDEELFERLHLDQSLAEALPQLHIDQLQVLQGLKNYAQSFKWLTRFL